MNARDIAGALDEQDGYDFAVEGEDLSEPGSFPAAMTRPANETPTPAEQDQ